MRTDHPAAKCLFWFCVVGALSCGGYAVPAPKTVPPGPPPPEVERGEAMVWRAPLFPDPSLEPGKERGTVRVRNTFRAFEAHVEASGLRPVATYRAEVAGAAGPLLFVTDARGRASLLLAAGSAVPLPDARVRIADASGNPALLGVLPDWRRNPRQEGPVREEFAAPSGGETVRAEVFRGSGRGLERLEFRFAGFEPGAALLLRPAGGEGIPVVAGSRGRATLRWRSRFPEPLPFGAYSVGELRGTAFEVVAGGEVVVEGIVP